MVDRKEEYSSELVKFIQNHFDKSAGGSGIDLKVHINGSGVAYFRNKHYRGTEVDYSLTFDTYKKRRESRFILDVEYPLNMDETRRAIHSRKELDKTTCIKSIRIDPGDEGGIRVVCEFYDPEDIKILRDTFWGYIVKPVMGKVEQDLRIKQQTNPGHQHQKYPTLHHNQSSHVHN